MVRPAGVLQVVPRVQRRRRTSPIVILRPLISSPAAASSSSHHTTPIPQACREELAREPRTLVVCSSYHIGKERAFFGVAEALGCRVFVTPRKARTLRLLQLPPRWLALLTDDPRAAGLHVVTGGGALRPESLLQRYGLPLPRPGGGGAEEDPMTAGDDDGGDGDADGGGDGGGSGGVAGGSGGGGGGGGDGGGGGGGSGASVDEAEAAEDRAAAAAVAGEWKAVLALRPTGARLRRLFFFTRQGFHLQNGLCLSLQHMRP